MVIQENVLKVKDQEMKQELEYGDVVLLISNDNAVDFLYGEGSLQEVMK